MQPYLQAELIFKDQCGLALRNQLDSDVVTDHYDAHPQHAGGCPAAHRAAHTASRCIMSYLTRSALLYLWHSCLAKIHTLKKNHSWSTIHCGEHHTLRKSLPILHARCCTIQHTPILQLSNKFQTDASHAVKKTCCFPYA